MAGHGTPHYHNEDGHRLIHIGAKEFMCIGAKAPFDHPHIFIDMGDADEAICSYCSTLFRYRPDLHADETDPKGCLLTEAA